MNVITQRNGTVGGPINGADGCIISSLKSPRNRNHQDSGNDIKSKLVTVECGLLADLSRESYWVRRVAKLDILSQVSINATIGKARPKPQRRLESEDVSPSPLFENPKAENFMGFESKVPNQSHQQFIQRRMGRVISAMVNNSGEVLECIEANLKSSSLSYSKCQYQNN
ncbi:hypothetical protein PanWU01x14_130690 [Parasponia andersonii]|uniref:Uncharacterized protein n=1 Tax=Parasponia andersonii TaxID=3476 RepID=A0A2P5CRC1_PARAD|nr:hypothetical protein PanWU01x14_130690 [Parasponia andersonii]